MGELSRRGFLLGTVVAGAGALAACTGPAAPSGTPVTASSPVVRQLELQRRRPNQPVTSAQLVARPVEVDLGGRVVPTWAYGQAIPGPVVRARAGDLLQISVDNQLPAPTSVHCHGIAMSNDMDGAPGLTQEPIAAGARFDYEFTASHPGTYFYHSHSGLQLDRGLYGVLIIDDPAEPGDYDHEWLVVLDDWLDGIDGTPDDAASQLGIPSGSERASATAGMDHGAMGGMHSGDGAMLSPLIGAAGDVAYPLYLINGRVPADPTVWTATPGQRARIRFVNAGADTVFRVALGGHQMTVTHTDGFPVEPDDADALLIGMGERVDVVVTLADGAFPLFAQAEGKTGYGYGIVRTGSGQLPAQDRPDELDRRILFGTDLTPTPAARVADRAHDRYWSVDMGGTMAPYRWTLNGRAHPDSTPLDVAQGERIRMRLRNMSDMVHPMHLHGHTFALADTGLRKDTVTIRPMRTVEIEFDADNPGQWAFHCHNAYHQEAGMMTTLSYLA
ncbi:MAG TPA: multicopper oxidase family protein [Dermatophilaceae bacterium]|nr:multicopper oxidase family protein [Dermatophilaceae bacterium]HMT90258.1 multicopper oxidase family protein [Dermatophilaceae bacterium]